MVSAVRGATTVVADNKDEIIERVCELVDGLFELNGLLDKQVVSINFSITDDLQSINPAAALRAKGGYSGIPLFCAQEPKSDGMLPKAVRVIITWNNDNCREPQASYLYEAKSLRPDLLK